MASAFTAAMARGSAAGSTAAAGGAAGDAEPDIIAFELFRLPTDFFSLEPAAQWEAIAHVTVKPEKVAKPRKPCRMTLGEEALAVAWFSVAFGMPLLAFGGTIGLLAARPWHLRWWLPLLAVLALHPLPRWGPLQRRHKIGVIIAKYFTCTLLVDRNHPECGDAGTPAVEESPLKAPAVCLACPHGVINFGAFVWVYFARWITGLEQYTAGASVVNMVPGLRYVMAPMHIIPADRNSLKRRLQESPRLTDKKGQRLSTKVPRTGGMVGIVPDGIAGIFKSKPGEDVLFLGKKRGLMRICLEEGAFIMGGWFNGTSEMFSVVTDPFGLMEWLSRRLKVSLFIPIGRWFTPVPHRVPVTMCSNMVRCKKTAVPTEEEVEKMHNEVYGGLSRKFEDLRHFAGYPERRLVVL